MNWLLIQDGSQLINLDTVQSLEVSGNVIYARVKESELGNQIVNTNQKTYPIAEYETEEDAREDLLRIAVLHCAMTCKGTKEHYPKDVWEKWGPGPE